MNEPILHPWIDTARAPVYEIRFPEQPDDTALRSFCEVRETWATRARYPVSWVVDLSRLKSVSASQRRVFGEHLERFEPHDIEYNRGSALVVPSAFLRGVVTAVFWLKVPKFPHRAFETVEEARVWARDRVRRDSLVPPRGSV